MNITQEKNCNINKNFSHQDPRVDFFNHCAHNWDASGPNIGETLNRLRQIQPQLGFSSGMSILEVGCGTGQITGWLIDIVKPGKVISIDFSPAMIDVAKSKNIAGADFRVADICDKPKINEKFDVVFCFNAFPHFRDKQTALLNIRRLLKSRGFFIALHFSGSRELNAFHASVGGAVSEDKLPDESEWKKLLEFARFKLIEYEDKPDLFLLRAQKNGR